jgi:hypothetical protein
MWCLGLKMYVFANLGVVGSYSLNLSMYDLLIEMELALNRSINEVHSGMS